MAIAPRPDPIPSLAQHAPEGRLCTLERLEFEDKAAVRAPGAPHCNADGRKTDLTGAVACGLFANGVGAIIRDAVGRGIRRRGTTGPVIGRAGAR